ncbi:MAG: DUF4174 domain-containing protein [Alphaproteobacteria bacterium]|nr:DUF4174 domain-containing protein [Alphaproteobacteria bacterium]
MRQFLFIISMGLLGVAAQAADKPMETDPFAYLDTNISDLDEFTWQKRPVIVFADSPNDPNFQQQLGFFQSEPEPLTKRDVVVLIDTDPSSMQPLREKFRPRGFMLVLIGKDGSIKLRKPFPLSVRELSRTIDKMPMRRREIKSR